MLAGRIGSRCRLAGASETELSFDWSVLRDEPTNVNVMIASSAPFLSINLCLTCHPASHAVNQTLSQKPTIHAALLPAPSLISVRTVVFWHRRE